MHRGKSCWNCCHVWHAEVEWKLTSESCFSNLSGANQSKIIPNYNRSRWRVSDCLFADSCLPTNLYEILVMFFRDQLCAWMILKLWIYWSVISSMFAEGIIASWQRPFIFYLLFSCSWYCKQWGNFFSWQSNHEHVCATVLVIFFCEPTCLLVSRPFLVATSIFSIWVFVFVYH